MTIQEIIKAFGGRLVGNNSNKKIIAQVIQKLPEKELSYITKKVWFLSSSPDAWAYTFHGRDIPDKYLILLSDELFEQSLNQIQFTILHEIGHVLLNHRNSIGFKQTKEEINKQEDEADEFAKQYI
jgi:hypothetical protein